MYEIEGGIQIFELIKAKGCDMDRVAIPPHVTMRLHFHKTFDELFYVIDGKGVAQIDKQIFEIAAGDSFVVNQGEYHAISTKEASLNVLTICLPHFDSKDIYYDQCERDH